MLQQGFTHAGPNLDQSGSGIGKCAWHPQALERKRRKQRERDERERESRKREERKKRKRGERRDKIKRKKK